ncbi:hypothetical protein EJ08DRAFT_569273, partial [Tothia fuscella]
FPAEKKVSFKDPLIEEIHNEKYTRRHSDILDSPESASTLSLSTDSISTDSISTDLSSTESVALKIKSPKLGDKRDSSSESDSDTCPETPVAGRRKRQRDWVWTLGDLPGATPANTTSA